jgi:hypothetical protein
MQDDQLKGVNHTLDRDRSRRLRGDVEIRDGGGSGIGLRPSDRFMTTALTLPLLARYGYLHPQIERS